MGKDQFFTGAMTEYNIEKVMSTLQEELPDYSNLRKLGEGGTGIVFRATHQPTQRRRAIKWNIDHKILKEKKLACETEISEANTPPYEEKLFEHPGLLQIYEYGKIQNIPYVIMEFLKGANLETRTDSRKEHQRPTLKELELTFTRVAETLQAIHAENYIHRDIKLDNIQNMKLIDYDLMVKAPFNQNGTIFCSPHYFTPEHFSSEELTEKTDLYMLATAIYASLNSGVTPYINIIGTNGTPTDFDPYTEYAEAARTLSKPIEVKLAKNTVIAEPEKWEALFQNAMKLYSPDRTELPEFCEQMKETFEAERATRQKKRKKWTTPT